MPQVDLSAFTEMRKNALTVFPEWQRQITQQMQPMADLQRQMRQIALPPQSVIDQFNDAAKNIRSSFQFLVPSAEQLELFKQLSELELQKRALERIGLLPHRSMPVSLLTEQDDDVLRSSLQQHYTENWERIGDGIRERVNSFDIDDEAKAVMTEAVDAHRNGHYRSVCRLLLPEIERVARVEFEGNRAGPVNMKKVMVEAALDLPLSKSRLNGYFALLLFDHLADHLYVHVDEKNRLALQQDPVPNRHAAIHGIVVYRSFTVWLASTTCIGIWAKWSRGQRPEVRFQWTPFQMPLSSWREEIIRWFGRNPERVRGFLLHDQTRKLLMHAPAFDEVHAGGYCTVYSCGTAMWCRPCGDPRRPQAKACRSCVPTEYRLDEP